MSAPQLPSGRAFARRVIILSYVFSVPALVIVMSCISSLLELTSEQWRFFFLTTAVYGASVSFPMMGIQRRMMQALSIYLDARLEGGASLDERRAAFATLVDLPRKVALLNAGGWLVPVLLVSGIMWLRFPRQWAWFESGVLVLAGVAAGFVAASFMIFLVKRSSDRVRAALTLELPEPSERRVPEA